MPFSMITINEVLDAFIIRINIDTIGKVVEVTAEKTCNKLSNWRLVSISKVGTELA